MRRLANNAVKQMDADNDRLKGILSVSKDLSTSLHAAAVSEIATTCARQLTSADVALMMIRQLDDKPLVEALRARALRLLIARRLPEVMGDASGRAQDPALAQPLALVEAYCRGFGI